MMSSPPVRTRPGSRLGSLPAEKTLRALVTRPRREAEALAALLAERGIEVIVEPMIEIAERGAALPDPAGLQAILLTSANGARALAKASSARAVPVFAVGDATARAARAAGFCAVESAGGDVADLARLVRARLHPAKGTLLHIAGSDVAGDLAGMLGADGFAIERTVLYAALAATALSPPAARLIGAGGFDLALFFSPRSAAVFAGLVTAAGLGGGLATATALSISAAADAALGDLPFQARVIAAAPTQAALLARIAHLAAQPA